MAPKIDPAASKESMLAAYGLLLACLVVPQFILVHHYLHLLVVAPLLVWIGCQRSLLESRKAPEDTQVETVTKKDAMKFPIMGSCVLFGLYIVIKFVQKEYLDLIVAWYFSLIGTFALFGTVQGPVTTLLRAEEMHHYKRDFHYQFWKKSANREPFNVDFTLLDAVLFLACGGIGVAYGSTQKWYLNNILGCSFSIQGIEMISIGSYAIGCILLVGLFFYDIFWVFGTDVMVAVAKGLNAPVKILFPKAINVTPVPCGMLGLGDIVIPGIFIAMMLRFDAKQQLVSAPYFHTIMVGYVAGLVATIGVMHVFDAAQPALLYLVPACLVGSLGCAAYRGELNSLLKFSEEIKEEKKEQ